MNELVTVSMAVVLVLAGPPTDRSAGNIDRGRGIIYYDMAIIDVTRVRDLAIGLYGDDKNWDVLSDAERIYWVDKIACSDYGALMMTVTTASISKTLELHPRSRDGLFATAEIWSRIPYSVWKGSFDWKTLGQLHGEQEAFEEGLLRRGDRRSSGISSIGRARKNVQDNNNQKITYPQKMHRTSPEEAYEIYEKGILAHVRISTRWLNEEQISRLKGIDRRALPEKQGVLLELIEKAILDLSSKD